MEMPEPDACLDIDWADSFPRYFYSFEEADQHTRSFLKWRIWKHRDTPHHKIEKYFLLPPHEGSQC